jgi:PRTRC genetic system protein E
METNFFENIASLNVPGKWNITIQTDGELQFTMSALYTALQNGDNAAKIIPPMLFKGTAQELDEGFFNAIAVPVQQTAGLYTNMENYLKEVEQARLASKQEQDKKAKEAKDKAGTATTSKKDGDVEMPDPKLVREEKKKAYEEAMKSIIELCTKMKYSDALAMLPSEANYPEKKNELDKKREDLNRLQRQYDTQLFKFNQA